MGVYHSKEELERILSRLWERIFADPQIVSTVADAKPVAIVDQIEKELIS